MELSCLMDKVKKAVCALVNEYCTNDPFEICASAGIHVFFSDLPDVTEGVYYRIKGHKIILINERLNRREARVVAAHELGHAVLHPKSNYVFMTASTLLLPQRLEREAELFCCELLLYGFETEICPQSDITARHIACIKGVPENMAELWLSARGFMA